jgi:hypothetical protein
MSLSNPIKDFKQQIKDLFPNQTGITKHFNDLLASHSSLFNDDDDITKFFLNLKNAQDEFFDPQYMPNVSTSTLAGYMKSLHEIVTNSSIAPVLKLNLTEEYEELLDVIDKRKKNYNNIARKASRNKDKFTPTPTLTLTTPPAPPPTPPTETLEDPLEDQEESEEEEPVPTPNNMKAVSMLRKYKNLELDPFKRIYLEAILDLLIREPRVGEAMR